MCTPNLGNLPSLPLNLSTDNFAFDVLRTAEITE